MWRRSELLAAVLVVVSAYLTLKGLDNNHFWDDEAQTAIIAKNHAETGRYTTWDGRNLYTYRDGSSILPDLEYTRVMPRLPFLLASLSFDLLGVTTFAARLPFALAGLLALIVFWFVLRRVFPDRPVVALYALGLTALSTVYMLQLRQCRYYGLGPLFVLTAYLCYDRALAQRRWRDFLGMAASAALLFHANYMWAAAILVPLGVSFLVFHARAFDRRGWVRMGGAIAAFLLATVPYAVGYRVWDHPNPPMAGTWEVDRVRLIWWFVRDMNLATVLPWPAMIGLALYIARWERGTARGRRAAEFALLTVGFCVMLGVIANQPTHVTSIADVRYLLPILPFAAALIALLLEKVHARSSLGAAAIAALLVLSNLFTLTPVDGEHRWLLPAYVQEVHGHTMTPDEAASTYLLQNASQDDLVVTVPDHLAYPLMFYTGHKVKFCCALSDEAYVDWKVIDALPTPARASRHVPDWVIAYGATQDALTMLQQFSRPVERGGRTVQSDYKIVAVLDVYAGETQRPELPWHHFGTVREFDKRTNAVYVFRRQPVSGAPRP